MQKTLLLLWLRVAVTLLFVRSLIDSRANNNWWYLFMTWSSGELLRSISNILKPDWDIKMMTFWVAGHWWEVEGEEQKEGCFDWGPEIAQIAQCIFHCVRFKPCPKALKSMQDLRKHGFKTMQEITEGLGNRVISLSKLQHMMLLASACLIAAIGESVEVEGGQGGRGWEYLLGMPLWSEPLERTEKVFDVCNFSMPPQQWGHLQRKE